MAWLIAVGIAILLYGIEFLLTALGVWIVCWAFGLVFSWQITIGIFVLICLVTSVGRSIVSNK